MPPPNPQRARGHRPSQSVNPRSSPAPPPPQPDEQAPAPARGPRRQYAQNQGAYFTAEANNAPQTGPPAAGGHARAASQAFFSPAAMMDPNGAPSPVPFAQDQQQFPYPTQQPQQIPAYGQQTAPDAAISNQFSQMGISGQQNPAFQTSTTNLVGLPLNPAELFMMDPPEIRLPANVSHRYRSSSFDSPGTESLTDDDSLFFLRLHSPPVPTRIATPPINVRPLTPFPPRIRSSTNLNFPSLSSLRRIDLFNQETLVHSFVEVSCDGLGLLRREQVRHSRSQY